jgi:hypothetical protein
VKCHIFSSFSLFFSFLLLYCFSFVFSCFFLLGVVVGTLAGVGLVAGGAYVYNRQSSGSGQTSPVGKYEQM